VDYHIINRIYGFSLRGKSRSFQSQAEPTPRADPCSAWGLRDLDSQGDQIQGHTRIVNQSLQPNQGTQASRNRRPEVFPYKKAYEGVIHSSVGSGATPTGCASAHPRTIEKTPNNPFRITPGLRGYYRVPILGYPKKGNSRSSTIKIERMVIGHDRALRLTPRG
jgi:hypothetical protein